MAELPGEAPLEEEKPVEEQRPAAGYWTIEDTERLFIVIHSEPREKPWTVIAEKLGRTAEDCEKWYKYILTAHSQIPEEDRRTYSGTPTNSKKRSRRKASSVDRPFMCQVINCRKAYGTEGALKFHMTHKHPDVKYIPSYLTPYNPTYKNTYTLFNGQQDGSIITTAVMDQSGNGEHDPNQMTTEHMAYEIHQAALEQLQAQQGELTNDGEAVQEQMIDHGEPQTPNEEIPESVVESMQADQTQNTVEGEQSVSQAEQPEQEGEHVEHVEQENTEGGEGDGDADQTQ